jgi:hypothetical protein
VEIRDREPALRSMVKGEASVEDESGLHFETGATRRSRRDAGNFG